MLRLPCRTGCALRHLAGLKTWYPPLSSVGLVKKLTPLLDVRGHSSLRESFSVAKNVRSFLVRASLRCLLYVRHFPLIHQGSKKENANFMDSTPI